MTEKRKQQKAKASTPGQLAKKAKAAAAKPHLRIEAKRRVTKKTTFIVLQKHEIAELE